MACEISIATVVATGAPGQLVASIAVDGTAVECESVVVQISCGAAEKIQAVTVDAQGGWHALFADLAGTMCVCGDPNVALRVVARCKSDPTCLDTRTLLPIPCYGACPTISHIQTVTPPCAAVLAAGEYYVTFNAYIDGAGVTQCLWNFGDVSGSVASGSLPVNGVATATHAYECPGEYQVTLIILSDCEPDYFDDEVQAFELSPCGCPSVNDFTATPDPQNPCHWTFSAKIGGAFAACVEGYLWSFGDGATDQTPVPQTTHIYSEDSPEDEPYKVTLTMLGVNQGNGGPCSHVHDVVVAGCSDRGSSGDDDSPCPPWNPFCKGWNLCGLILLLAIAAIVSVGVLMIAGCTTEVAALYTAAWVAGAIGLVLLAFWLGFCRKAKGFCDALHALMQIIHFLIVAEAALLLFFAFWNPACVAVIVQTIAYYGVILAYLFYIHGEAECPDWSPWWPFGTAGKQNPLRKARKSRG